MLSVIMTVYNGGSFVAEAIESVLGQTFEDFEFIIIANGSTDSEEEIIRNYARYDARIRPFFLECSVGISAMNFGVRQVRGKWIARMDQDDISLPCRFQTQLEFLQKTGVDVCGSSYENIGIKKGKAWCPESHEAICREMLFRVVVLSGVTMMRSEIAKENAYRKEVLLDDYEWPIRISSKACLGNVPAVLLKRRCHMQQASRLMADRIKLEFQRYRFQHFYSRYPSTPLPDYLALARVSDRQPMTELVELRRAGRWLVDLARHPDLVLRRKMARRWQETCERSRVLGSECETIFNEFRGQFDVDDEHETFTALSDTEPLWALVPPPNGMDT